MSTDEEALLFRLLAYSLVRHLDLRLDRADAVYFELLNERPLVRAWLAQHRTPQALRAAIAEAARGLRGPREAVVHAG